MGDGAGAAGFVTVRPNGEATGRKNFNGDGGATPVYSRMNDNNDATYGAGAGGSGQGYPNIWYAMTMGDIAPPGTARVYRIRTRARYFRDVADSGHNEKVSLTPRCPGTSRLVSSPRDYYETGTTSPVQEKAGVWRNHDPDGREWTTSRVNSTQLEIYGYKNNVGVGNYLRVAEVYMDVDIREKPTVSGVTVTGASTTRPTIDWTFNTNPDGDQQYWYRIKMFTAAQYGAAGFDPEKSAAFWDSGQVASGSNTVVIKADLQNGVTYKAYVKAAQSFHLTPWYTDWALSSTFTVALGPPADPTMSLTIDDAFQRLILTLAANQNMLLAVDSDFESGLGNWTTLVNCAALASATFAANGVQSMRLTATAGADMSASITGAIAPLVAGRTYTIHARARAGTTARAFRIEIDWKDAGGSLISTSTAGATDSNANFTTTAVAAVVAPAGTRTGTLRLIVIAPAAAEQHYFDMVGIWPGSSAVWTSGGQAGVTAMLLEYLDAAAGSRNLMPNQIATAGVATRSTAGFVAVGNGRTDFDDTTGPNDTVGSIRWTTAIGASTPLNFGIDPNLGYFDPTYGFPVVPGKQYTLSFYAKAGAAFTGGLVFNMVGPTGSFISNNGSQSLSITTSWQRFSVTLTAPAGASWARARIDNTNNTPGVFVWVGQFQMTEGATVVPWVPGQADQRAWQEYHGWDDVTARNLNADDFQEETVYDYELPRGRPRLYRLRAVNSITGTPVGSANYVYAVGQVVNDGNWYLVDPYHPWLNVRISPTDLQLSVEESLDVVHDLGDNRPVVMADRLYGEDATGFSIVATGIDQIQAIQAIVEEQHTLVLRSPFTDRQWPIRLISRSESPVKAFGGVVTPTSRFALGYVEVEAAS